MAESEQKKRDVVVIAIDGSEYSDYALQFYIDNLHKPDNHVLLVHATEYKCVTHPAVAITGDPSLAMVTDVITSEEKKTDAIVEKVTEKIKHLKDADDNLRIRKVYGAEGISHTDIVRVIWRLYQQFVAGEDPSSKFDAEVVRLKGEAGPTITHLLQEKNADYVVVGCRGKGTIRRTLTGSVTDFITHHSSVPVLVARHKDHLERHHHGHHGFHINPFHHEHKHGHKKEGHTKEGH